MLEATLEELQPQLQIPPAEVSVIGVQTSFTLPHFAWCVGNCLSLRFRYDILREKFIGFNDLKKYKKWNLLGYPIHEEFETYIAFPDVTEPNKIIAITRNYECKQNKHFFPQYKEQDYFIFLYSMPLAEVYDKIDKAICNTCLTLISL
ncbi:MAG: hypothetical protein NZ519_08390 [Bacteroidia bacterium]|nr:hypothetical protein [Bacteroidia bacterium]MDW8301843.1 hypothetical protein [Bacteroidia bacterium]